MAPHTHIRALHLPDRIFDALIAKRIDTIAAVKTSLNSGELQKIDGLGDKSIASIREKLADWEASQPPSRAPTSGFFAVGLVLLVAAISMVVWAFFQEDLSDDRKWLLRWLLPLASGFSAGSFVGSITVQAHGIFPGVFTTVTSGFGVWLLTHFMLFQAEPQRVLQSVGGLVYTKSSEGVEQPIEGAEVQIAEYGLSRITGKDGRFAFRVNGPVSSHVGISAKKIGYMDFDAVAQLGDPSRRIFMVSDLEISTWESPELQLLHSTNKDITRFVVSWVLGSQNVERYNIQWRQALSTGEATLKALSQINPSQLLNEHAIDLDLRICVVTSLLSMSEGVSRDRQILLARKAIESGKRSRERTIEVTENQIDHLNRLHDNTGWLANQRVSQRLGYHIAAASSVLYHWEEIEWDELKGSVSQVRPDVWIESRPSQLPNPFGSYIEKALLEVKSETR